MTDTVRADSDAFQDTLSASVCVAYSLPAFLPHLRPTPWSVDEIEINVSQTTLFHRKLYSLLNAFVAIIFFEFCGIEYFGPRRVRGLAEI